MHEKGSAFSVFFSKWCLKISLWALLPSHHWKRNCRWYQTARSSCCTGGQAAVQKDLDWLVLPLNASEGTYRKTKEIKSKLWLVIYSWAGRSLMKPSQGLLNLRIPSISLPKIKWMRLNSFFNNWLNKGSEFPLHLCHRSFKTSY